MTDNRYFLIDGDKHMLVNLTQYQLDHLNNTCFAMVYSFVLNLAESIPDNFAPTILKSNDLSFKIVSFRQESANQILARIMRS